MNDVLAISEPRAVFKLIIDLVLCVWMSGYDTDWNSCHLLMVHHVFFVIQFVLSEESPSSMLLLNIKMMPWHSL